MAGVLPVSTPATAAFAHLFGVTSTDPTDNQPGLIMRPFQHSFTELASNMSSENIRDRFATFGHRRFVFAATIISGGKALPYMLPHKWTPSLIGPNPALDNKYFAFSGELVGSPSHGHTVEIHTDAFRLLNNQVLVPTVPTIQAFLQADANNNWMGPYNTGDQGTEILKGRKIIPIPHSVVGLFLAQDGGVPPRYYFQSILPQLEADGVADACLALTHFFQMAITRKGAGQDESFLEMALPSSPGRIPALMKNQQDLLQHHFPQLSSQAATAQHNLIAQGIGVIASQQQSHYDKLDASKTAEKSNALVKWLGESKVKKLLRLTGTMNQDQLKRECPVYDEMAATADKHRRGVLQTKVEDVLTTRREKYLSCSVSPGLFLNFTSLKWQRSSENSAKSGFLGNLFLFCEGNDEYQEQLTKKVDMMRSGDTAINTQDAEEIIKLTVHPPLENKSLANLKRAELLYTALLPSHHPALLYIRELITALDGYRDKWEQVKTKIASMQPAKDVLLLQQLSLRMDRFWKEQGMSDVSVASLLPSPTDVQDKIDMCDPWEPQLSATIQQALKVPALCRLGVTGGLTGPHPGVINDDVSALTGVDGDTILGRFFDRLNAISGGSAISGGIGAGGGISTGGAGGNTVATGGTSLPCTNSAFSEVLFNEYKTRLVNNKTIKSSDLRKKIKRGELDPLPSSKLDLTKKMCLAWHTKGMCNTDCPLSADHVHYSNEELGELKTWCSENYPGNPQE